MSDNDYSYESIRRVTYGEEGMTFIPVCSNCGRFVKADETYKYWQNGAGEIRHSDNATCSKCGRVKMIFEVFI